MMPVLPSPKRSNGFSIDSLVSKDCGARPQGGQTQCGCPGTQDSMVLRTGGGIPPCSAAFQTLHGTPHPAFLTSAAAAAAAASYPEGLHPSFEAPHHGFSTGAGPLPGGPLPPGFPCLPGGPPGMPGILPPHLLGLPQKESFPFYTWLLARHGNYLSHRLTGAEAAYLFPFRKPKRIRTAFSPSQLLQLEHAFEKNHYVVGQERKDLAHSLNLTETQVKVWFQNRRTKHKRTAQEENEQRRKTDRAESESEFVDVESPPDSPPESPLSPGMEGDCDADSDCPASPAGMPPSMTSHHIFRPNPTTSCISSSSPSSSTSSSDVMTRRCDSQSTLPPHTNVYTSDSHLLHNKVV